MKVSANSMTIAS